MSVSRSMANSPYMEWAKLYSIARYNLAVSGVVGLPLAELGVTIDQLEINGPTIYGYPPLLQAIAERYRVQQECVVFAMGTSMANYLALAATTEVGDEILVEHPTYELLLSTARYLGLEIKRFARRPEDGFAIDVDEIKRRLTSKTRLIVLCNIHNPSGALTSDPVLREVGALAETVGAYVMVDEVYREMLYEDRPQSSFLISPDRFIVTNSLTKAYGLSGLRCGWVLAKPDLAKRMYRINDLHGANHAHPAELLSEIAFRKLPEISRKMQAMMTENRKLLKQALSDHEELDYFWPEHGAVAFPRPTVGNCDELVSMLRRDYDVSVVPGRFFEMPDRFRIGVGMTTESVRDSLRQFNMGMAKYRASLHVRA